MVYCLMVGATWITVVAHLVKSRQPACDTCGGMLYVKVGGPPFLAQRGLEK